MVIHPAAYKRCGGRSVRKPHDEFEGGDANRQQSDPVTSMAHLKSGKLRALATSSKERFAALPDIPSVGEAGITNSDIIGWWSVYTKGYAEADPRKLETLFNQIAVDEETKTFLANLGSDPFPGPRGDVSSLPFMKSTYFRPSASDPSAATAW